MVAIRNANYEAAVDAYLNVNEWVGEDLTPLVTGLFFVARQLDKSAYSTKGLTVGLTMEYRMLFVELHKHRPVEDGETKKDALDTVLTDIFKKVQTEQGNAGT